MKAWVLENRTISCTIYNVVAAEVVASRSCRGEGLIQSASSSPAKLEEALPHLLGWREAPVFFAVADPGASLAV